MPDDAPRQAWDAALYESKHAFVWKEAAGLVDILAPRPGEFILDLGCGTGQLTAELAARGAEVVGVDSSAAMVEQARANYPALTFLQADARDFALPETFDAVFSNAVLHWVPKAGKVIDCVRRALRPGGRYVVEFGGRGNVRRIAEGAAAALAQLRIPAPASPWYFPGIAEYAGLLEQAGLEVTYASLFDRPTPLEGEDGLRHWLTMFGRHWVDAVPAVRREEYFRTVEGRLRSALHSGDHWFADYRRLRVSAINPGGGRSPS